VRELQEKFFDRQINLRNDNPLSGTLQCGFFFFEGSARLGVDHEHQQQ
jgi:hypothetical protein